MSNEYRGAEVGPDAVATDAAEVAALIADVQAGTEAMTGPDIALQPLLSYAHALTLFKARDYLGAQRTAYAAAVACRERLWIRSSLCLDISSTAGLAEVTAELTTQNPDRMALPVEEPISSRQHGVEYTEARCRVILVGDIGDDGAFTNVRVADEAPAGVCRQMALSYATSRRYRPIAQAQPGRRRQDIILRFVLTSP